MSNAPAPQDSDSAYFLDWAAGWYCVYLSNIPNTAEGHCREYTFTFSWEPDDLNVSQAASSGTSRHGCQTFGAPSTPLPGVCFLSPSRHSLHPTQSISIVGRERSSAAAETDAFSTTLAIRFRDRPND
jgi:hypothetical protein